MSNIWPTHCSIERLSPGSWRWTVHLAFPDGFPMSITGHAFTRRGARWSAARTFKRKSRRPDRHEEWTPA